MKWKFDRKKWARDFFMTPVWVAAAGGAFMTFLLSASIAWDFFFCPPSNARKLKKDVDVITKQVVEHWFEYGKRPENLKRMLGLHGYLYASDWRYEGVNGFTGMSFSLEIGDYGACGWEMYCSRSIHWKGWDNYADQERFFGLLTDEVRATADDLTVVLMDSFLDLGEFPSDPPPKVQAAGWWYKIPFSTKPIAHLSPLQDPSSVGDPILVLDFSEAYVDT